MEKGILLESGTNELELVEFEVGQNKYGINVIKVKEIIQPLPITTIPHSHSFVEGIIQLRGEVLPVVSMEKVLGYPSNLTKSTGKYIVTEFNRQKVVFHVDNVSQIHRISWQDIEKPSTMVHDDHTRVIGVVKQAENMILILDFESIMVEINPESGIHVDQVRKLGKRERSNKKVVIAEDSPLLRKLLHETLTEAGYENIDSFENGELALNYLLSLREAGTLKEDVQIVITDIEMPQMDGHHLTRRIKEEKELSTLPVIIFSSLITDDLKHKGEKVGAEAQVSKPEIEKLVQLIDQHIK
ncbi:chemotaxis protein CheV [Bacillus coahuilensis m2-6]|uniref:chemotaxis protein n=1 Tax=Bacillus coahuilensis TaxID=408580 RepID=UPI000750478F|nr:chemotaxis protein [Bacillus coahuilensis]KUP08761.1 chemotaxis protein CheV [Bacillus coahuilensis m2-6]